MASLYAAAHPFEAATDDALQPSDGAAFASIAVNPAGTFDFGFAPSGGTFADLLGGATLLPITSSQSAEPSSSVLTSLSGPEDAADADAGDEDEEPQPPQGPPDCDAGRSALYCVYTVQPGDTLSLIATEFGLASTETVANWQLLVESNRPDITSADEPILAGQNIRVPVETGLIHLVLGGETLGGIAEAFGVASAEIVAVEANGLSAGQSLLVGQEILVPSPTQLGQPAYAAEPVEEATAEPTPEAAETATPEPVETEAPAELTPPPAVTDTPEPTPTPEASAETPTETGDDEDTNGSEGDEEEATPTVVAPENSYPFIWPVSGPISSYFGPSHPLGIDIDLYNAPNAPIGASAAGIVTFAGGDPCCSYGLYVIVDHGNGYRTLYAHFSELYVSAGQVVAQGQALGLAGDTGYSTGNHLHFEVHLDGDYIDPLTVLP